MRKRAVLVARQPRIARQRRLRFFSRERQQLAVQIEPRDAEARRAGLARAEHFAFAAQTQILLGDAEAVFGLAQDFEPRARDVAKRRLVEQQAGRAARAAPDPAAQLMELREAEAFGVFDHHDRSLPARRRRPR